MSLNEQNYGKTDEKYEIDEINQFSLFHDQKSSQSFSMNIISPNEDVILPKKKKTLFTKEEDKRLIEAVKEYGDNNWALVASYVGNRTRRQCCERWRKFLCPNINVSSWTEEEDELLLAKYNQYGPKWALLRRYFNNRTDVNIKTRYIVLSRRIKKREDFLEKVKLFSKASSKSKSTQKKQNNCAYANNNMKNNKISHNLTIKLMNIMSNDHNQKNNDDQSFGLNENQISNVNHSDSANIIKEDEYSIPPNLQNTERNPFDSNFDDLFKIIKNDMWDDFHQETSFYDDCFF